MYDLDPEDVEERALATNRPRVRGVYGCIDTSSRKLFWLRGWKGNSDPKLIGHFYLDYFYESRMADSKIGIDKVTETGKIAALNASLDDTMVIWTLLILLYMVRQQQIRLRDGGKSLTNALKDPYLLSYRDR